MKRWEFVKHFNEKLSDNERVAVLSKLRTWIGQPQYMSAGEHKYFTSLHEELRDEMQEYPISQLLPEPTYKTLADMAKDVKTPGIGYIESDIMHPSTGHAKGCICRYCINPGTL